MSLVNSNNDFKIFHSKKQANSSEWKEWRPIHAIKFTKFSVILNPNDNRIEIYAIENGSMKIWYTKQKEPDSIDWQDWKEIKRDVGNPERFDEIAVGINRKKQIIIFAREPRQGKIWSTKRTEPDFPGGNGWRSGG